VKATFPTAVARYGDSVATAPVAPGTIIAPLPTVTGSPTVGSTLRAISGATKPSTTRIQYRWFRGSSPISGAISSSYVPTVSDTGKRVTVVLTYSAAGYTTLSRTSAATAPVT
jgi:hypothetical protein